MAQSTSSDTATFRGKTYWCKVLGEPRLKYQSTDKREWSFELSADKHTKEIMKAKKARNHLKFDEEKGQYFKFKKDETKKDGSPAKPIMVVDADGNPWDQNVLIGNGSEVEVLVGFSFRKAPDGTEFHVVTPMKMTVLDHKEYEKANATPTSKSQSDEEWSDDA